MLVALTREVSPALVRCELTFLPRRPLDLDRAMSQHRAYRDQLERLGAEVISLPAEPDLPDSVFVEDTAVVLDEVAVLASMGAASRSAEVDLMARVLGRYRPLLRLMPPACLEGGDVMRVGRDLYVGLSGRTNGHGIESLERALAPFGYRVHPVSVHGCLHLKSACTYLGEDIVLANPSWVDGKDFKGLETIPVHPAEPMAGNVLRVQETLLVSNAYPRTIGLVEEQGFSVVGLDLTEFHKAEGGVTCLSLLFPC